MKKVTLILGILLIIFNLYLIFVLNTKIKIKKNHYFNVDNKFLTNGVTKFCVLNDTVLFIENKREKDYRYEYYKYSHFRYISYFTDFSINETSNIKKIGNMPFNISLNKDYNLYLNYFHPQKGISSHKICASELKEIFETDFLKINGIKFYINKRCKLPKDDDICIKKYKDGYILRIDAYNLYHNLVIFNDILAINENYKKYKEQLYKVTGKKFTNYQIFKIAWSFYRRHHFNSRLKLKKHLLKLFLIGIKDINNDGNLEAIFYTAIARYGKHRLICYDIDNKKILWRIEKFNISDEIYKEDINKDGKYEIFCASYAPCNEIPPDFLKTGYHSNRKSFFYIVKSNGKIYTINNKKIIVSSKYSGFSEYRYLYLKKQKKILLGLFAFKKNKKKLELLDLKNGSVKTLDIVYHCITDMKKEGEKIYLWDLNKTKSEIIVLNSKFELVKKYRNEEKYGEVFFNKIMINKKYFNILNTYDHKTFIINDKNRALYKLGEAMGQFTIYKDKIFALKYKENSNLNNLFELSITKNNKLEFEIWLILILEFISIFIFYTFYLNIKLPAISPTNSYFVEYKLFNKLFIPRILGRVNKDIKIPKKLFTSQNEIYKLLKDICKDFEVIYKKHFIFLQYTLYKLNYGMEFPIIQRIAHDLKNQLMILKLSVDNYKKDLVQRNNQFVQNISSALKNISNSAITLSKLSYINKPYFEKNNLIATTLKVLAGFSGHKYFYKIDISALARKEKIVYFDKALYEIALKNLFSNAFEAIDENGYIILKTYEDIEKFCIIIKNSFTPFKDNKPIVKEKLFEVGYTNKKSGSGLGLSIVKTIMEKFEWDFDIEIKENEFIAKICINQNIGGENEKKSSYFGR